MVLIAPKRRGSNGTKIPRCYQNLNLLDLIDNYDMRHSDIPDYVAIEDSRNLVRDTRSMCILNVDSDARARHRAQREKILNDKRRIEELERDMTELKSLVQKLLEKNNG